MSIARKPTKHKSKTNEAAIKAVIEKGGSIADNDKPVKERKNLQLRMPSVLINNIYQIRGKRAVPPSRHTWILEAIHEKLEKEQTL